MQDLVLVTEANPQPQTIPYIRPELEPLQKAFAERGVQVRLAGWDDPSFDWSAVGLAILRTTWNYHRHLEQFLSWTKRVPRLLNRPEVVAWNARKTYLREVNVPIVPTEWLDRETSLEDILLRRGWNEAVLKPTVSGGAFRTQRFNRGEAPQQLLRQILTESTAMLQPYFPSVEATGERSLIYFGGQLSHAVRRKPPLSTGEHGAAAATAEPDELELAERLLAQHRRLLYARVDLARDAAGKPCLMELELIEPSFFLDTSPGAAHRFVEAVLRA